MSTSEAGRDLSSDERTGLELIHESGGTHQGDFWKEPDISSQKGSRIAEMLESLGFIEWTEIVYSGHITCYLEPAACDLDFPMLMAGDTLLPLIGEEGINASSSALSQ